MEARGEEGDGGRDEKDRSFGEGMKVKAKRLRFCQHGSVEKGMRRERKRAPGNYEQ